MLKKIFLFLGFLGFLGFLFSFAYADENFSNFFDNFEIKNKFQNPTYLEEKEIEKEKYFCENEKDCKVNFDFRGSFGEKFKAKEFSCLLEYDEEKIENCNPNAISIEKETNFKIKIFKKKDEKNFKEREIKIFLKHPTFSEGEGNSGSGNQNNENSGENGTGEKSDFEKNFEIKNKFQNPTYLKEKELEKVEYFCENEKDCKVNFDFRESFTEKFKLKDFSCFLEYEEEKIENCNPNAISIEKETNFKIKIFKKNDEKIFKEREIKIFLKKEEKETGSGSQNEEENNNSEEKIDFEKNFEIKNKFQNPTYLKEKELEKVEYFCENEKDCKVNFDFRESFGENFKEKEFSCLLEYEEEKIENCNPNTILIEKETNFKIKIISKKDEKIFKEREIKIFLKKEEKETGSGSQNEEENNNSEEKSDFEKNFEIKNKFQNPTYLEEKEVEKEKYFCENEKDCKVNFDFRESFTEKFKAKDFSCFLEYDEEKIENCNPNAILIERETNFKIKIISKKDEKIFKEREIKIFLKKEEKDLKSNSGTNFSEQNGKKLFPKIKVQSGVNFEKKCEKEECKVNFIFENNDKNISCEWNFGKNSNFKNGTEKRCNPSSVKFLPGKHLITLKIFDKNNPENFEEDYFEFENTFKKEELGAKIILTGISKKYQKGDKKAKCLGVSSCKLNFGLENISNSSKKFVWNFGNGKIFEGKNPKSIEFFEGNYILELKIFDENNYFKEYFFEIIVKKEKDLSFFEDFFESEDKEKTDLSLKIRKNTNNFLISGNSKNDIFMIKSFDFPLIGKFIYYKKYLLKTDGEGSFNEKIDFERIGDFNLDFYENNSFSENKKIEVTEKNLLNLKIDEIYKKNKILEKKSKKKIKKLKKEEKQLFLEIFLQGKQTKSKIFKNKKVVCFGNCSINFSSKTNIKDKKNIVWDFGNGQIFNGKNPKSIKFKTGKYKVFVKYFSDGEEIKDDFFVEVYKKIKKTRKKSRKKKKNGPVNLVINIQGRISKNKILSENKLICYKTCSVNFDGRKSSGVYKELFWDFGNGKTFKGENPKSFKYENFGKYIVKLKTEDFSGKKYEKIFEIEFLEEKLNKEEKIKILENKNLLWQEKKLKKDDLFFIFTIIFLIGFFGTILFKRYKIF